MIYHQFFKLFFQRIDAEKAHRLAASSLRFVTRIPGVAALLRRRLVPRDPALTVHALGLEFSSPLGVAAGVDKDASWFEELGLLGFGFVEIGTITAEGQPGNPSPRVFRISEERAIVNSMGFPNPGAEATCARLSSRSGDTIIGVNIGKTKLVEVKDAVADYVKSTRLLAPLSDYVVVNVSSPNTPGLRSMQTVETLRPLIGAVREEIDSLGVVCPVLLKIGPDLPDSELDRIADLSMELKIDGIVSVNTTTDESSLSDPMRLDSIGAVGGISGAPLKPRATEVLRRLRARVADEVVLVSVGGIESAEDVWERILAGATLVQAHTGFVYGGPLWPSRINKELAKRVRDAGVASIAELVGTGSIDDGSGDEVEVPMSDGAAVSLSAARLAS